MNEPELKLPQAPIVEAVLDIECDMPPGRPLEELEQKARGCYRDRYPKFRTQFVQEHRIEATPGESPKASFRQGLQAYQFLQDDEKQLVQVRDHGFAFNRLAPYTSLDDYLPEIERAWKSFVALASPEQVRFIRLRYINRILLPMPAHRLELEQYFRVCPHLPDEEGMHLLSFLNHHVAVDVETGHQVTIVLSSQPVEDDRLPLIFDNSALAVGPAEPEDWPWLLGKVQSLRALENRIFKNTLTEQCLNLFRQP